MDVRLPGVCMLAYCSFCMDVLTHNSVCINVLCLYLSGVEGMQRLSESLKETADTEEKVRMISYFDLTDTCSLKKLPLSPSSLPFPFLPGASSLRGTWEGGVTSRRATDPP